MGQDTPEGTRLPVLSRTSTPLPRAVLALLVVGMLAITACGARLTDEERADAIAAAQGGGSGGVGADVGGDEVAGGDTGGSTDGSGSATDGGGGGGDTGGSGGDTGGGGGGGGDTGGGTPASGGCTSSGKSSDVGVSGTAIKIGNISTIGGPVPGFGQTGRNAVRAYVAMVNAEGGVCGRKLEVLNGDDRLEAGTNKSETERLMKQVFAFVGNTTVVDDGGAISLEGTNVPDVSLAVAEKRIALKNNFSPNPIDLNDDGNGTEAIFRYFKSADKVTKGGVLWPAQATAANRAKAYINDMEAAGIDVVVTREVAVTETNYSAFAAEVKNNDVDIIITTLEVNGMARLARAFQTNGYFPKVPFYGAQAYGKKFIEQAGDAAEGTKIGVAYEILEGGGSAVSDFATWYPRVNPGADIDFFAIQAWIAAHMFVEALRSAGADPKRDAVLAKLRTFTSYDAGGLVGRINPAQKKFAKCYAIVGVKGGKWTKISPAKGFTC